MFRALICSTFVLAVPAFGADEKKPATPPAPPPPNGSVKIRGDQLHCTINHLVYKTVLQTFTVVENNKPVTKTTQVFVPVYQTRIQQVSLSKVEGYLKSGEKGDDPTKPALAKLKPEQLKETLARTVPIIFMLDGKKPTNAEAKVIKEGTVVLVLPSSKKE